MGELAVLDRTGDTRLQWSKHNPEKVTAAENRFKELKAKGYAAFKVNKDGDKGIQIDDFDPSAERLIMIPQIIGG